MYVCMYVCMYVRIFVKLWLISVVSAYSLLEPSFTCNIISMCSTNPAPDFGAQTDTVEAMMPNVSPVASC